MKQNKFKISFMLVVCILALGAIFSRQNVITAEAASEYREFLDLFDVTAEDGGKTVVKSGSYYFKLNNKDGSILISTKRNSGYEKTPIMQSDAFTNGKQAYYTYKSVLYKYEYASQKVTKLTQLDYKGAFYSCISAIYGNQIFMTLDSSDDMVWKTYSYNTKTGKLKKVKTDCYIKAQEGQYVIAEKYYHTDVSPNPLILYKITSKGLTEVKTLTKYSTQADIINGNIYYSVYGKDSLKKGSLYRCKIDGTKAKKLVTVSGAEVYFGDITAKKCTILKDRKKYVYTYATKKMVEVKE